MERANPSEWMCRTWNWEYYFEEEWEMKQANNVVVSLGVLVVL